MTVLLPNNDVLQTFVGTMFRHASKDAFVSLRAFTDNKKNKCVFIDPIAVGDPQFLDVVFERARQAAVWHEPTVFCPPITTFRKADNARVDNVFEGVCLSVDCDREPVRAMNLLVRLLGHPTVIVASGGVWEGPDGQIQKKRHLHWLLNQPTRTAQQHEMLREARELAVLYVGGDASAIPLVHPLRWPGSVHRKGEPRLAEITALNDEVEIDLPDALDKLRKATAGMAKAERAKPNGNGNGQPHDSDLEHLEARDINDVIRCMDLIDNPQGKDWERWNSIGMLLFASTRKFHEDGLRLWHEWSSRNADYDPAHTDHRWQNYHRSPPTKAGFGKLVYLARQKDPSFTPGQQPSEDKSPKATIDPVDLWGKFKPPALPRGILPDIIEQFAFEQGRTMGADIAGIAAAALVVCAAAIPDSVKLQVKRHHSKWLESARLWVALVGPPSTKKSPIMRNAAAPLLWRERQLAQTYQQEKAKYDALPKSERAETDPPKRTQAVLRDVTIEAAQEVLKDSPDGVLCYQDEMSGWFGSMDRYSTAKGASERAFWLQAFNGEAYSVHRIGRGAIYIDNLSVSLIGGIQPEPIRKIAAESVDDGLLQRLLPIVLDAPVLGCDEPENPIVIDYNNMVGNLRLYADKVLHFDDAAQAYRRQLEQRHLDLQACETLNRKLSAHIGKYDGIFARLCVIWHCIEHVDGPELPTVISEHTAKRVGTFLHKFLFRHAIAFHVGMLGLSNDHDSLTAIAGYILAHKLDKITIRDVKRGDRTMRKLTPDEIVKNLEQLEALSWLDRIPNPRPTLPDQWLVNPAVHTKFAEKATEELERRKTLQKLLNETLGARTA